MYSFLALLTGTLIAVMVALNGALSDVYGVYCSTAIIHLVGLLLVCALLLFRPKKLFHKGIPWYLYMGGALGVPITVCNNLAFPRIGVSAMLALGLFAQSVAGLAVDQYGLLGMPRRAFDRGKLIGLALTLAGIAVMTDAFDAVAVIASLAAGLALLVARTLNARLAGATSLQASTFFNYAVGLALSLPACALFGRGEPAMCAFALAPEVYIYLGGAVGVCVVLLLNYTVARVSAFSLSLLLFIGQVFAGLAIDVLFLDAFSPRLLIGGALVALGLCLNVIIEKRAQAKSTPRG